MIKYASGGKESFAGKRVAVSGSGNVAQYAALKVIELGGTVVSLSDSKGAIVATTDKGIDPEMIETVAKLKVDRKQLSEVANTSDFSSKVKYIDGARPWLQVGKVDVALPSATQNEVSKEEAEGLIKAGCKFQHGLHTRGHRSLRITSEIQQGRSYLVCSGQSCQCWWCGGLRSGDGPELCTHQVDF